MSQKPKFCLITDRNQKRKMVEEFSKFFHNRNLSKRDIDNLADKIAQNAFVMAAVAGSENIGFVGYYCNDTKTLTAYLSVVIMNPRYRGMGTGTAMLKEVLKDCADRGYKTVRLEVDNENTGAIKLYKTLGFRKEKESSDNSAFYCMTL